MAGDGDGDGGGGGGADEMLHWCVSPYHCTVAPNWGGRTLGSQTPSVPATLGLNVQMDGGRNMLQNCSKLSPHRRHRHAQLHCA